VKRWKRKKGEKLPKSTNQEKERSRRKKKKTPQKKTSKGRSRGNAILGRGQEKSEGANKRPQKWALEVLDAGESQTSKRAFKRSSMFPKKKRLEKISKIQEKIAGTPRDKGKGLRNLHRDMETPKKTFRDSQSRAKKGKVKSEKKEENTHRNPWGNTCANLKGFSGPAPNWKRTQRMKQHRKARKKRA